MQWFSTFLMLWHFNTVPYVVVTSNHEIISLPLNNSNSVTVMNHNVCFLIVLGHPCESIIRAPLQEVTTYRLGPTALEKCLFFYRLYEHISLPKYIWVCLQNTIVYIYAPVLGRAIIILIASAMFRINSDIIKNDEGILEKKFMKPKNNIDARTGN